MPIPFINAYASSVTVGTQAAVLAGLDVTMFIEFNPPHDNEWGHAYMIPRALKFFYYICIVSAFCANMTVVGHSTILSVLGSSLALRGPDGSMLTATDGLYEERKSIFYAFGMGLAMTVGSVVICVWLILSPEAAVVCMSITIYTCFRIYSAYLRVTRRFDFDESETVDFSDIFEGPAAIQAVSLTKATLRNWVNKRGGGASRNGEIKSKTSSRSLDVALSSSTESDDTEPLSRYEGRRGKTRRRSPTGEKDSRSSRRQWQDEHDAELGNGRRMDFSHLQTV